MTTIELKTNALAKRLNLSVEAIQLKLEQAYEGGASFDAVYNYYMAKSTGNSLSQWIQD